MPTVTLKGAMTLHHAGHKFVRGEKHIVTAEVAAQLEDEMDGYFKIVHDNTVPEKPAKVKKGVVIKKKPAVSEDDAADDDMLEV
jgi:hypothetical protein